MVFLTPSPLASYHIAPLMREGVSRIVVGRDVGRWVIEKGLLNSGLLLLELLPLPEVLPLASKLGLHGNPSSNLLHASSHLSPLPGGLYPKKVGELQYGSVRHWYQSLYWRM